MGKIDTHTDGYFNDVRFADMCNAMLYHGEQIISAEELTDAENSMSFVDSKEELKLTADKVKMWKGRSIRLICIENQSHIDYRMVIRSMLSEALGYHRQWREKRAVHRQNRDLKGDEYLSGIAKSEKLIPIITIIVYYGKDPWDGARTLYELLGIKMETGAEEAISNYRLNLFDYHEYENFGQFHTDLKNLFEFLRYENNKEILKARMEQDEEYKHLNKETTMLLEKLTNTKILRNKDLNTLERRTGDVCKAFEDYKQEGYEMGLSQGLNQGLASLVKSLKKYIHDFEKLYQEVISNEEYKNYTREQVKMYY